MFIYDLIKAVGEFLWGGAGLALILSVGVYFTLRFRFLQFRALPYVFKRTFGSLFSRKERKEGSISPFAALCTALGASVGVGNIAGVAAAVTVGGPGAVFWMVAASFFGMMTAYAENYLGVLYRVRDKGGGYSGGAMYYLRDGLGGRAGKSLGWLFALFCVLASFGMGNMSQVNTLTDNFTSAFGIVALEGKTIFGVELYSVILGVAVAALAGFAIFAGMGRIIRITERIVPFMVIFYIAGCITVLFCFRGNIIPVLSSVMRHAFSFEGVCGGVGGYCIKDVVTCGVKRGVFSNEAGLGSTVCVGASADVAHPSEQGMWGMLNVFIDTTVMCTLTALTLLCTGIVDLDSGRVLSSSRATTLMSEVFGRVFGSFGGVFISLSVVLFAFATVLGWSVYGMKAFEYLFGKERVYIYKCLYVLAAFFGAVVSAEAVWEISDIFNALMMIPNVVGLLYLRKDIEKIR